MTSLTNQDILDLEDKLTKFTNLFDKQLEPFEKLKIENAKELQNQNPEKEQKKLQQKEKAISTEINKLKTKKQLALQKLQDQIDNLKKDKNPADVEMKDGSDDALAERKAVLYEALQKLQEGVLGDRMIQYSFKELR